MYGCNCIGRGHRPAGIFLTALAKAPQKSIKTRGCRNESLESEAGGGRDTTEQQRYIADSFRNFLNQQFSCPKSCPFGKNRGDIVALMRQRATLSLRELYIIPHGLLVNSLAINCTGCIRGESILGKSYFGFIHHDGTRRAAVGGVGQVVRTFIARHYG